MAPPSKTASQERPDTFGVYTSVEQLLQLRNLAKDLRLETRKQSRAIMGGLVRTRYRGRGMEFAEVRPYQPGDDIRTIDWRVTARMQAPYTKLFQEEKERPVFVMIDQRSSMFFGSKNTFKSVFAAQLASTIAWIANNNGDRIGALLFGDTQQSDIRARRGKHSVLDLIHQLATYNTLLTSPVLPEKSTNMETMLTEVSRIAHPGSRVLLISDFHDFDKACAEPLSMIAKRSDISLIHIYDELERQLPPLSQLSISNGQQRLKINSNQVSADFRRLFDHRQELIKQSCINGGAQYVNAPASVSIENFANDLFSSKSRSRRKTGQALGGRK